MKVDIENMGSAMAADLNVLGAAVKVLLVGGSSLNEAQMKRACGASYHLWKSKGGAIVELVRDMENADEKV